jgi:hypothetical protein
MLQKIHDLTQQLRHIPSIPPSIFSTVEQLALLAKEELNGKELSTGSAASAEKTRDAGQDCVVVRGFEVGKETDEIRIEEEEWLVCGLGEER